MFEAAQTRDASWALLTRPESVMYATGLAAPVDLTQPLFSGGPVTALVGPEGVTGLVATDRHLGADAQKPAVDAVVTYAGSSTDDPSALAARHVEALRRLWTTAGASGSLAIEARHMPWGIGQTMAALATRLVPFDDALARTRAIKTNDEIARLRRSAAVAEAGQVAARAAAREGLTELELLLRARAAMEEAAGSRLVITADVLSGIGRSSGGGGNPTERELAPGDPVLLDLAPRVDGYWGDSCTSFVIGEPSRSWTRSHDAVLAGLLEGLARTRAGVATKELDATVRDAVRRGGSGYRHHTGHGIGVAHHELPRLAPESGGRLEPGMVVTLEPGAYDPEDGGVRLEAMVVVTEDACEIIGAPPEVRSEIGA